MKRTTPVGRGFTLVELLVVIGIIALLISILLPALKKAQTAGAAANCASNMRTLGIAVRMYAEENKGWAPRAAAGYSGSYWHVYDDFIWWQTSEKGQSKMLAIDRSALAPYLGAPRNAPVGQLIGSGPSLGWLSASPAAPGSERVQKAFRCPADFGVESRDQYVASRQSDFGGYHYSYSMNSWFNANPTDPNRGAGDGGGGAPRYKFSQVTRPSDRILMGEERWPNDGYWVLANWQPGSDDQITDRHGGMGNILYCDAHVERQPAKYFSNAVIRNITGNPFADPKY